MAKGTVVKSTAGLMKLLGKFEGMTSERPPISSWNPPLSGDIDIKIDKDGMWWHEGGAIKREKLMRLFSTILKKEGDSYYLVTPVEKWRIQVEDLPFMVVLSDINEMASGIEIDLITSAGDEIRLSASHFIELDDNLNPMIEVRDGLYARLNRNVYYELANLAQEVAGGFSFQSNGKRHVIG